MPGIGCEVSTAEDLKELGVTILGHRRKMLTAIAELSASSAAPARLGAPPPSLQRARALLSEPKRRRYRAGVRPVLRRKRRPKKLVSS